ncbi:MULTISPECIES: DUF4123 domain-containing protein [Halomonas]|uniref:DUF4123 domain-containing protein n=1 Tax=Halomonas halophila TaxID=29573 RepID=A0ABQ0U6K4_9GAMM|nr:MULTISPECIES: DUF4123 domain-containing protein [Halomonas]MDR5890374.1 DUF4123 domain-containing protein [Halomonas salina]WJY08136.1 DUF4123 domain-containing protein [Halomonas halophila]GEK74042.1 hypothetical protein HHA04nite_25860 [Halomonas halophila]
MIRSDRITHVLVDGVRYPDALRRLYARDDLAEIEPLYLMTRFKDLAEQGPILVAPRGRGFVDEILAEGDGELTRAMSLLTASATTEALGDHLLRFVEAEIDGISRLVRFADPLVLRHWLASFGDIVPAEVMGPIHAWRVAHWAPAWGATAAPQWRVFEASESSVLEAGRGTPVPAMMGAPQQEALEAVARWQFKERLSAYFSRHLGEAWAEVPLDRRGDWLDARLDDAQAWGAQTERQFAIWCELALRRGETFMTASDGLYARWVAGDASRGELPRQQQLYALDDWSRSEAADQQNGNRTTRMSSHD